MFETEHNKFCSRQYASNVLITLYGLKTEDVRVEEPRKQQAYKSVTFLKLSKTA
jgi:hypothetical protein